MLHTAKEIASGQDPLPFDFDLARWNQITVKKAANKPAEILLEKLHRSHQEWLRFLDEIPVAHLHRRGRHGRGDVLSVEGFMRRYANHEARHASEIHEALQRD
jgi:hypothetical protein